MRGVDRGTDLQEEAQPIVERQALFFAVFIDGLAVDGGLSQSTVLISAIEQRGLAVSRSGDPEATLRGAALFTR